MSSMKARAAPIIKSIRFIKRVYFHPDLASFLHFTLIIFVDDEVAADMGFCWSSRIRAKWKNGSF
jgi:hypothetical protein